jgi:hypothetical protein
LPAAVRPRVEGSLHGHRQRAHRQYLRGIAQPGRGIAPRGRRPLTEFEQVLLGYIARSASRSIRPPSPLTWACT